ncbi:hypothetical protein AUJ14_06150 [Candidatus Micrarchaeota archaeon CG1_02_55_22]|nr:MAG: hypothetical protein AUJ14_06150 [Candidatus Micrarchaeota archaeon CG1_02_55_22]
MKSGKALLGLSITFLPVSPAIITSAQSLVEVYSLKPRDAIHIATALAAGCNCIVSDDTDFDAVKARIPRLPLKKA